MYSFFCKTYYRSTERHLPYGITVIGLPATRNR